MEIGGQDGGKECTKDILEVGGYRWGIRFKNYFPIFLIESHLFRTWFLESY